MDSKKKRESNTSLLVFGGSFLKREHLKSPISTYVKPIFLR